MATCERVVKKPVPPPVEYVLRLTQAEANEVRDVVVEALLARRFGAMSGALDALNAVNTALDCAGVRYKNYRK